MMEFISSAFLALCGILALIGGLIKHQDRRENLLWAFLCLSIAGIGFLEAGEEPHTIAGCVSKTALVFFILAKAIKVKAGLKKQTPATSPSKNHRSFGESTLRLFVRFVAFAVVLPVLLCAVGFFIEAAGFICIALASLFTLVPGALFGPPHFGGDTAMLPRTIVGVLLAIGFNVGISLLFAMLFAAWGRERALRNTS